MTVQKKAFIGAAWLLLVIGLMLFVSAGSIRYWQGWTYWVIFSGAVLIVTLYFLKHDPELVARRTSVGPVAEPETIQKVIQALASILFCAELIIPGLDRRFGWSSVPVPLVVIGDVLVVIG